MTDKQIDIFSSILKNIGDIQYSDVLDNAKTKNGDICVLNLDELIKSVAINILDISTASFNMNSDDSKKINAFLDELVDAIKYFCNFLDYDGDGVVELVTKNSQNEIVEGDDIKLFLTEGKTATSLFKNHGNIQTTIFAFISGMVTYFTNKRVTQTLNDFDQFRQTCGRTYILMKEIKTISVSEFFNNKRSDIMKFIITLCIVIIPIIELMTKKIVSINASGSANINGNEFLSKNAIVTEIKQMYGISIEIMLLQIESLVPIFIEIVEKNTFGKKILNYIKSKCCC